MDSNTRWFIKTLRDVCNQTLEDNMVGSQTGHIEKIEVTDPGAPIQLRVTCYGAYSPFEATRVHENQGVYDVMQMIAGYLADRATRLANLEELKCP